MSFKRCCILCKVNCVSNFKQTTYGLMTWHVEENNIIALLNEDTCCCGISVEDLGSLDEAICLIIRLLYKYKKEHFIEVRFLTGNCNAL